MNQISRILVLCNSYCILNTSFFAKYKIKENISDIFLSFLIFGVMYVHVRTVLCHLGEWNM